MRTSLFAAFRLCLIFAFCASITACGIRPGQLEHPTTPGEPNYPRTYPEPATDPTP